MKWLLVLMVGVLLTACSSKPSDGDIEEAVQIVYTPRVAELKYYDIVAVSRQNGYAGEGGTYIVEVVVTYVTTVSFAEYQKRVMAYLEKRSEEEQFRTRLQLRVLQEQDGDFERGKRTDRNERFTLVKTEKGWRVKLQ